MKKNHKKWSGMGSALLAAAGGVGLLILFFCISHRIFQATGDKESTEAVPTENAQPGGGTTAEELDRLLKQEQKEYWLSLTPSPTPTPSPSPTPSPTPTPTNTPSPTATPSATPSPTAKPTSTPRPTATPLPKATPTVAPVVSGSYTEKLEDTLIVGDSLMESIAYYRLLDDRHVLAKVGARADFISKNLDRIVAINPSNIVLHFGNNNIEGPERIPGFINQYRKNVIALKEKMPTARIYVSSIYLTLERAYDKYTPCYQYIDRYNAALKELCSELGLIYIDNDGIIMQHKDLFEPDGVHMQGSFYRKYWLDFVGDRVNE